MASGNQELDQQFDDDVMLQLALQMSLQAHQEAPSFSSASTEAEVPSSPSQCDASDAAAIEHTPAIVNDQLVTETSPTTTVSSTTTPTTTPDIAVEKVVETPKKKKKVKKSKFKDLIASRMAPQKTDDEVKAQHQEKLKISLGGGQFDKLQKI